MLELVSHNRPEAGKGEPSLIPAYTAKSCATIRLIRSASTRADYDRSGCYHGSNVQRSIRGDRHTFWTARGAAIDLPSTFAQCDNVAESMTA